MSTFDDWWASDAADDAINVKEVAREANAAEARKGPDSNAATKLQSQANAARVLAGSISEAGRAVPRGTK